MIVNNKQRDEFIFKDIDQYLQQTEDKNFLISGQQFRIINDNPAEFNQKVETNNIHKNSDFLSLLSKSQILDVKSEQFI